MIGSLFAYRWLVMQFTHSTHIIQGPIQAVLSAHSQCGRNVTNWRRVEKVCRQRRRRSIPFTFQSNGDEVVFNSNNNKNGMLKGAYSPAFIIPSIHHVIIPASTPEISRWGKWIIMWNPRTTQKRVYPITTHLHICWSHFKGFDNHLSYSTVSFVYPVGLF